LDGSHVYGYIAQTPALEHSGGSGAEFPEGTHVHLYEDVSNAAIAYGTGDVIDPDSYVSKANVGEFGGQPGCVNCHGEPYLKHGYRAAQVENLPDFAACKSCHYDTRGGGHEDWQYMVDQPLNWGTAGLPEAEVEALYAYTANIMNDAHMSHAKEFPYPMSMANCATCHEDKLSPGVLDDANFTGETCVSCHSVLGTNAWPELADDEPGGPQPEGKYYQRGRAPALDYLWTRAGVDVFHNIGLTCNSTDCHGGSSVPSFDAYHNGYDPRISDSAGDRYADTYTATIDAISLAGNLLTIEFSASDPAITTEVLVSFYGWGSKHFIVPSHARDGSEACTGRSGDPDGCDLEYPPGAGDNPLFTDNAATTSSWSVTLDMAAYVPDNTASIPDMIASGQVTKAEITVTPRLTLDGVSVGLNAVTQTFDLDAGTNVEGYYKGDNAVVNIDKCNACHDQLAVTFHSGSGRGGDIVACRNCHNPTFDGSHLEMTSRSIENYVHAIHTFQAFDTDDAFEEFDPVFSARYNQHIDHVFPNFTIRNCEGCHNEGTYNVPDQSQSMPGVLSTSYEVLTWYEMVSSDTCSTTTKQSCTDDADCPGGETCEGNIPSSIAIDNPAGRNIGTVASYVTGPASRACGGCHRGRLINDDAAADLASWNAHTQVNGSYVPNDPDDEVLFGVIDKIMWSFE
jgi:OmcA/MtrC family decaheme c-type cytochrome